MGNLYSFARAVITMYHKLGGINNGNLLSHSSGGLKSEIMVLAGFIPTEGCEGRTYSKSLFLA
jgi:hypothetical protein